MLKQSQEFSTEALNAHQRTLRMRGRPKIVLARTYQEAMEVYRKYQNNILGVITDVRFPKVERGEKTVWRVLSYALRYVRMIRLYR